MSFMGVDWNAIYGEELYDHRLDSSESINLASRPEMDKIRKMLRLKLQRKFN